MIRGWESLVILAALVGGLALVHTLEPRQVMPVVYMALFSVQMLAAGLIAIRYWSGIYRAPLMLPIARVLAINGIAILMLALSTGPAPWADINEFRRWIVFVRIQLAVSGGILVIKAIALTWRSK